MLKFTLKKPRATNHQWEGSVVGIAQGRCQMDPRLFVGGVVQVPKMLGIFEGTFLETSSLLFR